MRSALEKTVAFRALAHVQEFLPMSNRDILKFEACVGRLLPVPGQIARS
ncbi:hypothetical protein [uncultured Roseibium sp.]